MCECVSVCECVCVCVLQFFYRQCYFIVILRNDAISVFCGVSRCD